VSLLDQETITLLAERAMAIRPMSGELLPAMMLLPIS